MTLINTIPFQGSGVAPPSGGSYRYWRINITSRATNNPGTIDRIMLTEMRFYDDVDADISTAIGAAAADESPGFAAGFGFDKVIDGTESTNNGWIDTNLPLWGRLDFGSAKKITRVELVPGSSANNSEAPNDWTIEGSDNDADWTTVQTFSTPSGWAFLTARSFNVQ